MLFFIFPFGHFVLFIFSTFLPIVLVRQCFKVLSRSVQTCVRACTMLTWGNFKGSEMAFAENQTNGKCSFTSYFFIFCHPNRWWWSSFYARVHVIYIKQFPKIARFNQVIVEILKKKMLLLQVLCAPINITFWRHAAFFVTENSQL